VLLLAVVAVEWVTLEEVEEAELVYQKILM
jgi:hypothetical protein